MKTIKTYIEDGRVIISPDTPTDLELKEQPADKNWDKLRNLGYVSCRLTGDPKIIMNTSQVVIHVWHLPETDKDKLEIELATYDWFYEMSDDNRVWGQGVAKDGRIQELTRRVGKAQFIEMWTAYVYMASDKFQDPKEFIQRYLARVQ